MKRLLSLVFLLPFFAACGWHDAEVELYWTFEGMGCGAAGVRYVEIVLEDEEGFRHESGVVHCRDESVVFEDLPRGRYRIWAWGYPSLSRDFTWELYRKVWVSSGYNEFTLDLSRAY